MQPASLRRVAPLLCALLTYGLCVVTPARPDTTDTAPGFFGAAVLACHGELNLGRIQTVDETARTVGVPYWAVESPDQRRLYSTFGPAPALLGRPAFAGLRAGDVLREDLIRARVTHLTGAALGVTAGFACLAVMSEASVWMAIVAAILAALSFAGAPVLGQSLWQQTAALPFLVASLAAALWSGRSRVATLAAPALALLAALLRPADAALSVATLSVWFLRARDTRRGDLIAALVFAAICVFPLLVWNLVNLGTALPAGQWSSNLRFTTGVFDLSPAHLGVGLAGLLVSPARGLVWFAPVAILGVVVALRRRDVATRILGAAVIVELLISAAFFRWWGGVSFGPRLLAGATWFAIVVAAIELPWRRVFYATAAVTAAFGVVGVLRYDPRTWEIPNAPDANPARLWQVADSPIVAVLSRPRPGRLPSRLRAIYCPFGASGRFSIVVEPAE